MTLLSIASKQIWPQVLGFLRFNPPPERLVLFHTTEEGESAGPARRLKEFFVGQRLLPEQAVELVRVPHDHFGNIVEALRATADRLGLDESNCRFHFTGGNKLMALATTEWCRRSGSPCFYLERDLRVFPFLPRGTDFLPQESLQLDPHLARDIEPLALLRCQLGSADVIGQGQRLTLNERGRKLPEKEIGPLLKKNDDFQKFLGWDVLEPEDKPGFALEFAAAVTLLKLGVPVVQRSVKLVPKIFGGSGRHEGELDLVFNWEGKLWVVDCKNRLSAESRVGKLRTEILRQLTPDQRLMDLLDNVEDELRERDLHPLKEDLLAVAEAGGLLGRAICVRLSPLPPQAREYARSRNMEVASKDRLLADLRTILFPKQPASVEQLKSLATVRTAAVA